MKLGPTSKVILLGVSVIALYFVAQRIIINRPTTESKVAEKVNLPTWVDSTQPTNVDVVMPSDKPVTKAGPRIKYLGMAWNAQMGLMFANGGKSTTDGSLMAKYGVLLDIERQDDYPVMQDGLVAFAEALRTNPQPNDKVHFVNIMGDGAAVFMNELTEKLMRIGPDYVPEIVGAVGFSRGEDALLAPPEWKLDPNKARGSVVAGFLRDGDWDVGLNWAGGNGIPNNPDETTYDPDAMNWVASQNFLDSAAKYNAGYCEERAVVKKEGNRTFKTGETRKVCVNAVVTWTPGDVQIVRGRGGLTKIVSTREYTWQMASTIIGIRKWDKANPDLVSGMLAAAFAGGDMVNASDAALKRGAEVSDAVYQEKDTGPGYWAEFYKGKTESDKQGNQVFLGGSRAVGAKTMEQYFGLNGTGIVNSMFGSVYRAFGNIVHQQYEKLLQSYKPVEQVVDTTYLKNAIALLSKEPNKVADTSEIPVYRPVSTPMAPTQRVSARSYKVNFVTGSAQITPDSEATLQSVLDSIRTTNLRVEVHGHTDSTGDRSANQSLSEMRAKSVALWFQAHAQSADVTASRFLVIGHGQDQPVAPNTSEIGRSQNRRVEIVLGTSS